MLNCMNCLHVLLQVAIVIKCHATLLTHDVFGFEMNFMNMLTEIRVFPLAVWALRLKKEQIGQNVKQQISAYLCTLVHNSDVLSKVAVLFAADWTRAPVLVMDIVNVPLQVCLEVATIATLRAFEVFNLDQLFKYKIV